jgi:hypothetical protein
VQRIYNNSIHELNALVESRNSKKRVKKQMKVVKGYWYRSDIHFHNIILSPRLLVQFVYRLRVVERVYGEM